MAVSRGLNSLGLIVIDTTEQFEQARLALENRWPNAPGFSATGPTPLLADAARGNLGQRSRQPALAGQLPL
jgi:hypothetical protein